LNTYYPTWAGVACATTCDASTAPANGAVGDCTGTLALGASCTPTCNAGYTLAGSRTCSSTAPAVYTDTAACNAPPCNAAAALTNGQLGTCTATLTAGTSCTPTCNAGYQLAGTRTCPAGGTTLSVDTAACNKYAITDGNLGAALTAWVTNPTTATTTYGAIAEWDTSRVTALTSAFSTYPAFNDDISKWNTASVVNVLSAFDGGLIASSFNRDIGKWNVARVTNVMSAFNGAKAFNQNLASWNVLRVTSVFQSFDGTALTDCIKKGMSTSWGATLQGAYPAWSALCSTPVLAATPALLVASPGTMVLLF
jgi:hypothetical protein